MSILETFYILFKTDADEAAKDINEVDKASDKAAAGLNKVDAAAEGVGASFKRMAAAIVGPLLTLATAGAALNIAIARAAAVRELDQFSSKLNSSVADVDAFQRSVKGMGGETAAALDTLVKLGEKVNEAFSDAESGARKDFTEWGLAFKNAEGQALGASDAMLELAGNLENVSRAEALARIKKLGIEDAASIDLLLRGRAALEARIAAEKELGVVTEEQAANVREYYGELGRAQNALTSVGNAILQALLPAMTKAVDMFANLAEWVSRNGTLVTGFFIGIAGVITAMYLPAMWAAAAATFAATWPFLLMAAAIIGIGVAVALVYEDVMAFLNDQPSLIGALVEKYAAVREAIEFLKRSFEAVKDAGKATVEALKYAWGLFVDASNQASEATQAFWSSVEPIWTAFKDLVSAVGELFGALGTRISSDLQPVIQRMGDSFKTVADFAKSLFEGVFGDLDQFAGATDRAATALRDGLAAAFQFVKSVWDNTVGLIAGQISNIAAGIRDLAASIAGVGSATAPAGANDNIAAGGAAIGAMMGQGQKLAAGASGAAINTAGAVGGTTVSNTSNVSVGNVTVNTQATDARAVAGAVRGELQKQLRGTAAQFDDGVDR
jgi:hypothetical protein